MTRLMVITARHPQLSTYLDGVIQLKAKKKLKICVDHSAATTRLLCDDISDLYHFGRTRLTRLMRPSAFLLLPFLLQRSLNGRMSLPAQ